MAPVLMRTSQSSYLRFSQQLVSAMGRQVGVESQLGQGFTLVKVGWRILVFHLDCPWY